MNKLREIYKWSNPEEAQKRAYEYLGPNTHLKLSSRKDKKYMVLNPYTLKYVHFGQIGYEDFLKHKNLLRRYNYIRRASNMHGNWRENPYSANNLSINILW